MSIVILGWILAAGGIGTLIGAALGYHTALTDAERKLKRLNDTLNNL